ncbi:hypothetical protein MTO96_024958 [Rhipicephalus appendiculatus]
MDPSEQRSAFEDSPSYDTPAVSAFNADPGRDAIRYGCQSDIEESRNQQQAVSLSKTGSGDDSPARQLSSQNAPSVALSSEQQSTVPSSLRFTDDDPMDHSEQSALFGHSDGDSTNQLVPQEMSNKPLELSHQQHCVFSQCSGDRGSVKQRELPNAYGETLDCDQQPEVLCNMGLRGDSIGNQEGLSREMPNPEEPRESALDELGSYDESKMNWEDQPSTGQSSADTPFEQSTRPPIVEKHLDSNENLALRDPADAEPWTVGTTPVSPSSSPSGRMTFERQPATQDAEEQLNSEERDLFVTASAFSASQSTPEHGTEFDDSATDQTKTEAFLSVALCGTDEPTVSPEASIRAQCSDDALTMPPRSDIPRPASTTTEVRPRRLPKSGRPVERVGWRVLQL